MNKNSKIYVAGHQGMAGAALLSRLKSRGYTNLVVRTRKELDLVSQSSVADFFSKEKPEYVVLAAGKTGGIYANNEYCADFIYENIMVQSNVFYQAFLSGVKKLVFFACSAVYPKDRGCPMKEDALLTGPVEGMTEAGAVAKIAGWKMCESFNRQYGTDFVTLIPTNIYGPGQKYSALDSMVVPALILKFHQAKMNRQATVAINGDGSQIRDFLYVDDLASAAIFILEEYKGNDYFNVATGRNCSIRELAEIIKKEVGYKGLITYDPTKASGISMKVLDVSKVKALGWVSHVDLEDGIRRTYADFRKQ